MNTLFAGVVPFFICLAAIEGTRKKVDIFPSLIDGAKEGLTTVVNILPSLVALLPAIYMFRASGAMEALTWILSPLLSLLRIPTECAPLLLIRPLSGSGALAVASDIMRTYGVDSLVGKTAAVMLGSTETTFYVVAVYFSAARIRKTRHAVPAALIADVVGFIIAATAVRLFM